MPSHCCVVGCTQRGYKSETGEKISFFNFPKSPLKRKKWIHAIRRQEGKEFVITEKTKVCSLHFKTCHLRKSFNGRIFPNKDAVPSRFFWSVSPKKRKPPKERVPLPFNRKQCENFQETVEMEEEELVAEDPGEAELEKPEVNVEKELEEAKAKIKDLEGRIETLLNDGRACETRLEILTNENSHLQERISYLEHVTSTVSSRLFNVDRFTDKKDVTFYTGFPNTETFDAILSYLNPGEDCANIRYKDRASEEIPETFYDQEEEDISTYKRGPMHKIKPKDQLFIVMCRLRRGFSEIHLAHLYGVAQTTISRIFISWINFMYLKFGQIPIWPSKEVIVDTMPKDFAEKYPNTRVIIDCTEIRSEMPSSLLLNSELFSSCKNHVTLKALVGIAPSGAITFISQLYTGSISDREIVLRSGLLSQDFSDGDSVMADKGFQIQDILPLGVTLNIPPFLGEQAQMTPEDVLKTQQIAGLRIHVERAINKIKNFHIWDKVVPLRLFHTVNQMWSVCAFLCNTHDPLISKLQL